MKNLVNNLFKSKHNSKKSNAKKTFYNFIESYVSNADLINGNN